MMKELYVEHPNAITAACDAMRTNVPDLIQGENGSAHGHVVKIEREGHGFRVTVECW